MEINKTRMVDWTNKSGYLWAVRGPDGELCADGGDIWTGSLAGAHAYAEGVSGEPVPVVKMLSELKFVKLIDGGTVSSLDVAGHRATITGTCATWHDDEPVVTPGEWTGNLTELQIAALGVAVAKNSKVDVYSVSGRIEILVHLTKLGSLWSNGDIRWNELTNP